MKNITNFLNNNQRVLGIGYSSEKEMVTSINCLKDYKAGLIGCPESIVTFGDAKTVQDIARELGLGLDVSAVIYPMITGSASISYARFVQESRYSLVFNFLYKVELGNKVLRINDYGLEVLNAFGLSAYEAGPDQFKEACGDKFVVQQKLGARLFVTLKLNFVSTADKLAYSLGLGAKLDLLALAIDVKLKFKEKIEKQNINLNLEIAAYQEGGEVVKLAEIFNNKNINGTYYAMGCDINGMDNCEEIIKGIINYAKLDFKKQVFYDGNDINGDYATLGNIYKDYTHVGLVKTNIIISDKIKEVRNWLLDQYNNHTKEKEFLENLLYKSKFISTTSNSDQNEQLGYKPFDVDIRTIDIKYDNMTTHGHWTWSPNQIFTKARFSLIESFKHLKSNLLLLESKDVGIPKCYQDPISCKKLNINEIDYNTSEAFKKAYQVISICNNNGYGRYFLPVDKEVYQAKAKFNLAGQNETNSDITFNIKNEKPSEIEVSLFYDELTRKKCSCGNLGINEGYEATLVYEGTFRDQGSCLCASKLCPSYNSEENFNILSSVFFIEIQTPI